jgi:hypothetical protein
METLKKSRFAAPGIKSFRGFSNAQPIAALYKARNAFEVDNAKHIKLEDAVKTFIPVPAFERVLSPKNQILIGTRGSGKTTWIRMLAHDHLMAAAQDPSQRTKYARDTLAKHLIGIYVPANVAFTGDLKNKPWQSEVEQEQYFEWRLNLHACAAFTQIIRSCIQRYVDDSAKRYDAETELCSLLGKAWNGEACNVTTVDSLLLILSELELKQLQALRSNRINGDSTFLIGDPFSIELFAPLRHAIAALKSVVQIPADATWMICLDEVEYLEEAHHRILNTQIRASNGGLIFKIATMPFMHHTLSTNIGDPIREEHDFEYLYIDFDPIDSRGSRAEGEFLNFARKMFALRLSVKVPQLAEITLEQFLGPSPLLDEIHMPLDDGRRFETLLKKYTNANTVLRAARLRGTPKYDSEIVRKLRGALLLKESVSDLRGNGKLRVYCGEKTIVRCSDGNVRRLMRILNQLVQRAPIDGSNKLRMPLDTALQNDVLENLANETLNRTISEPPNGALTADYLQAIGEYFKHLFYYQKMGSDLVSSVEIKLTDGPHIKEFVKQAVQLSLIARNSKQNYTDSLFEGVYHLAFVFAPHFKILPRRNKSVRLIKALSFGKVTSALRQMNQQELYQDHET